MADCFSLLKAVELVEGLRRHIKLSREGRIYVDIGSEIFCRQAADTIEQLLAENAKLKAERDAAVADLKSVVADGYGLNECRYCKYREEDGQCHHDCVPYSEKWGWEWRGVQRADT